MTRVVCFTGAQGTGKTTMMLETAASLKQDGYSVISGYEGYESTSISRNVKEQGFPINEKTNWITQYLIACKYMTADIETRKIAELNNVDYLILDRSVLDSIPYVIVSDAIFHGEKKLLKEMLFQHYELFPATLIKCEPLDKIVADGARSISQMFQGKVEDAFAEMFHVLSEKNHDVYSVLNESIEERLKDVEGILEIE